MKPWKKPELEQLDFSNTGAPKGYVEKDWNNDGIINGQDIAWWNHNNHNDYGTENSINDPS